MNRPRIRTQVAQELLGHSWTGTFANIASSEIYCPAEKKFTSHTLGHTKLFAR